MSITVNSTVVRTLTTPFIGANWFDSNDEIQHCKRIFVTKNQGTQFAKTLKKIRINRLRYPSGYFVNMMFPELSKADFIVALKDWATRFGLPFGKVSAMNVDNFVDIYQFLDFVKDNNLKCSIQLNVQTFYNTETSQIEYIKDKETGIINNNAVEYVSNNAVDLLQYIIDNGYIDYVDYLELGNEDYLDEDYLSGYTGTQYGNIVRIFIDKLRAVKPDVKFALTTLTYNYATPAHYGTFLSELITTSDFSQYKNDSNIYYVRHDYWTTNDNGSNLNNYAEAMKDSIVLDGTTERYNHLVSLGVTDPKIVVNECRAGVFGLNKRYGNSWATAIGTSRFLINSIIKPYIISMDFHNILNMYVYPGVNFTNSYYGIINYCYNETWNYSPFILHPEAYIIGIYNKYLLGNVLETESILDDVSLIASNEGNNTNLIITNVNEDREITIDLSSLAEKTIRDSRYMGGYPDDLTAIDYNDSGLYPKGVKRLYTKKLDCSISENVITVNLKANSVNIFVLEEA